MTQQEMEKIQQNPAFQEVLEVAMGPGGIAEQLGNLPWAPAQYKLLLRLLENALVGDRVSDEDIAAMKEKEAAFQDRPERITTLANGATFIDRRRFSDALTEPLEESTCQI
jgi:hypothetical protein